MLKKCLLVLLTLFLCAGIVVANTNNTKAEDENLMSCKNIRDLGEGAKFSGITCAIRDEQDLYTWGMETDQETVPPEGREVGYSSFVINGVLTRDVEIEEWIPIGGAGTRNLDLNGHTISVAEYWKGDEAGNEMYDTMFIFDWHGEGGSNVTIKDSSPYKTGAIDADNRARIFYIDGKGTNLAYNKHYLTLESGTLKNGLAYYGAGISMIGFAEFQMLGGVIENCYSSGTEANDGGGAILNHEGFVRITDGIIRNCSSAYDGGAIYNFGNAFWMEGGTIENCKAGYGITGEQQMDAMGGAIYNVATRAQTASGEKYVSKITGGKILNCVAAWGGAIANYGYIREPEHSPVGPVRTLNDVNADEEYPTYLVIYAGRIENCHGTNMAGALYMHQSQVEINGGKIINNTADEWSGAVYVQDDSYLRIKGGLMTGNHCTGRRIEAALAGALAFDKSTLILGGDRTGEELELSGPRIYGNYRHTNDKTEANVYLYDREPGVGASASRIYFENFMNEDAYIGISTDYTYHEEATRDDDLGVISYGYPTQYSAFPYFFSDNPIYSLGEQVYQDPNTGETLRRLIKNNGGISVNVNSSTLIAGSSVKVTTVVSWDLTYIGAFDDLNYAIYDHDGNKVATIPYKPVVTNSNDKDLTLEYNFTPKKSGIYHVVVDNGKGVTAKSNDFEIKLVSPYDPEPEPKDESCEKVIGPTWHWNNTKGVCEEVSVVGTATR